MEASGSELPLEVAEGFSKIIVVDDSFCVTSPTEITVRKKYCGVFLKQRYKVLDVNGNVLFQVDGSSLDVRKKRIMRDGGGSPILTMREKINLKSLRHRWMVHKGRSSEEKDLIFGVQRSHPLDMKPRLDVFMATDISEAISSFQLVGSHIDNSCKIYKGDTVIAEVIDLYPRNNFSNWTESFRVKINAGVDYAFIVALLVILTVNDYI
ncbi:protein LURP-one-related 9-like [Vigna radiata var. radiata]|uniref:Protein LURP-one-related 9-like n=1 Tax=Vigna radiata var. radiata TaxID=3916 RepID=A0A1S3UAD6_VIGRR|nr:protein LURP-one-related 9-like [Vigna radiata var. radiata]